MDYNAAPPSTPERAKLRRYLQRYGAHTLAYSTLQAGMHYFVSDPDGYIAYVPRKKYLERTLVLGDPICAPWRTSAILDAFLQRRPRCSFWQIQESTARALETRGFYVNEIGIDSVLDLEGLSLHGRRSTYLRRSLNRAERRGLRATELLGNVGAQQQFEAIADRWRKRCSQYSHELRFLARPFENANAQDVRRFVAIKGDQIAAFALFDPLYRDGRIFGYYAACLRSANDVADQCRSFLIVEAARIFKAEGKKVLGLGLSPCFDIRDDRGLRYSCVTQMAIRLLYNYGNALYNFQGLATHKMKYGAHSSKVFMASRRFAPVFDFGALLEVVKIRSRRENITGGFHNSHVGMSSEPTL